MSHEAGNGVSQVSLVVQSTHDDRSDLRELQRSEVINVAGGDVEAEVIDFVLHSGLVELDEEAEVDCDVLSVLGDDLVELSIVEVKNHGLDDFGIIVVQVDDVAGGLLVKVSLWFDTI